ncbi:hypothetical protein DFH27DRAFT_522887 [Peziza echinospora]|nr:hypothetical protein DFH27DRAFT_522887 [Peziza echinospora]
MASSKAIATDPMPSHMAATQPSQHRTTLPPLAGSCLCGDFTLIITNPRPGMILCHCHHCQINSASFFGTYITTDAQGHFVGDAGRCCLLSLTASLTIHVCAFCVFVVAASSIAVVVVNCGLFQNHKFHPAMKPSLEIFTTRRSTWLSRRSDALQTEGMPVFPNSSGNEKDTETDEDGEVDGDDGSDSEGEGDGNAENIHGGGGGGCGGGGSEYSRIGHHGQLDRPHRHHHHHHPPPPPPPPPSTFTSDARDLQGSGGGGNKFHSEHPGLSRTPTQHTQVHHPPRRPMHHPTHQPAHQLTQIHGNDNNKPMQHLPPNGYLKNPYSQQSNVNYAYHQQQMQLQLQQQRQKLLAQEQLQEQEIQQQQRRNQSPDGVPIVPMTSPASPSTVPTTSTSPTCRDEEEGDDDESLNRESKKWEYNHDVELSDGQISRHKGVVNSIYGTLSSSGIGHGLGEKSATKPNTPTLFGPPPPMASPKDGSLQQ